MTTMASATSWSPRPAKRARSPLKTRRNVINHLAYRVSNLQESAERLRTQRHLPLGPSQPAIAFGGAHVQFFLSPLGHIVELIEASTP